MCSIDISKYQINISNFRRVRSLGNGGFGEVYEVVDNQNRRYAAKVFLREKYPNQQTYNELVYREISIMIKESNPTTVNIRGFSTVDVKGRNNITILMNLEENGSLRDVIRRNEPYLDNTSKQIIFLGIVMGMCWLHKNNVIHRDLKPENILIDKNLYPHISDFGLAKVWENGKTNVQSRNWGTDGYMAPEIAFGSYTNAVDVYAFGFILYELITGTKASINRNIPMKKSFSDLINRCWSPCPENRPSFKEIFDLFNSNRSQYTLDGVDFERLSIYINFMVKGFNQKKQQQVQHQPLQKNQQQSYHQQSQPQNQHQQVNYMYSQQQQPHYQQSHSKGNFNQTPIQQVQHQPLEKNQQQVYHQQLHPQHQHQQVNYIYPQQQNHIQQNQQILYQVQPSETDDYDSSSNGNKRKHHKHKFSLKKLFKSSKTMSSEDDYY